MKNKLIILTALITSFTMLNASAGLVSIQFDKNSASSMLLHQVNKQDSNPHITVGLQYNDLSTEVMLDLGDGTNFYTLLSSSDWPSGQVNCSSIFINANPVQQLIRSNDGACQCAPSESNPVLSATIAHQGNEYAIHCN